MSKSIAIREFKPSDYEAAYALWVRTPRIGLSEADGVAEVEAFLLRNPGTSFVAYAGQHLVGTVLCGHDGRRGMIHHLVVASELRRQGIGQKLLIEGLRSLYAQCIDKCHLLVFQSNSDALAFWQTVGATHSDDLALLSIATNDGG